MNAKSLLSALVSLLAVTWSSAQPQPGTVLWTYDVAPFPTPAIGPDGTIYVTRWDDVVKWYVVDAITNAGSFASSKWTYPLPGAYQVAGIAVAADGTIYVANNSQYFYAVNPNGSQKWMYEFASYGSSPPAIGWDGTIYVVGDDSLYALSPDGAKKWAYRIWGHTGTPVIASDGTIFIRNDQQPATLYALNPTGTLKWSVQLPGGSTWENDSPAIGASDTIYVGGFGLYAFSPAGTQLWSSTSVGSFGIIIGCDGTIYANRGNDATLFAVKPNGQEKWHLDLPFRCQWHACLSPTTPAIDSGGTLYYTAANSILAISSEGQVQGTVSFPNPIYGVISATSSVIGRDGTVYATLSNTLFAISGTNSLADSAWPMFQQNARHTGKVEKPVLKNPQQHDDASFEFQLYAQLGRTNVIETSTNLSVWIFLTNVVITNVPMNVVDSTASNSPTRFYRASSP